MGYGKRDLARIEFSICLDCKEEDAGDFRRCLKCRVRRRSLPTKGARGLAWLATEEALLEAQERRKSDEQPTRHHHSQTRRRSA